MFAAIFNFIFGLIAKVGDFILAPVYGIIGVLIPSSDQMIDGMFDFLETSTSMFQFICQNLLIPQFVMFALVTYLCGKFTFRVTLNAIKFVVNLYNKLKL